VLENDSFVHADGRLLWDHVYGRVVGRVLVFSRHDLRHFADNVHSQVDGFSDNRFLGSDRYA